MGKRQKYVTSRTFRERPSPPRSLLAAQGPAARGASAHPKDDRRRLLFDTALATRPRPAADNNQCFCFHRVAIGWTQKGAPARIRGLLN